MKSFLSILLVALMFSLVISPVQAKCNAACKKEKANQKAAEIWLKQKNKKINEVYKEQVAISRSFVKDQKKRCEDLRNMAPAEKDYCQRLVSTSENNSETYINNMQDVANGNKNRARQIAENIAEHGLPTATPSPSDGKSDNSRQSARSGNSTWTRQ